MIEITPDELCPHVEAGEAERVGGVHFSTAKPPVSIGMCQQCLDWCMGNLQQPIPINADARNMLEDGILDAKYVDVEEGT
jgi:hypothetical protein